MVTSDFRPEVEIRPFHACVMHPVIIIGTRAGSSMRLVRLKPQGPGPNRGPDRPVQRKCTSMTTFGPQNF